MTILPKAYGAVASGLPAVCGPQYGSDCYRPEESKVFKQWWDEHQMPFSGIADPGHVIADDYGQQVKLIKLGRMPATILIDKQGIIRYTHFGESMSDIPATDEMLEIIDRMNIK